MKSLSGIYKHEGKRHQAELLSAKNWIDEYESDAIQLPYKDILKMFT
jgi:hypothetical protein